MDFQQMYDTMKLSEEQSTLLAQIEEPTQMLVDMQTNIMAKKHNCRDKND